MIRATDIHSLTDFRKNAAAHIRRLKRTNRPEVLTVNGEPGAIVMSPKAFEQLAEEVAIARSVEAIRISERQIRNGESIPAERFFRDLAGRHKIELPEA